MSKAVLVLPDMPDGCANCALCRKENRKGYNDYVCIPKNQLAPMAIGTDRPDWCPLRPMSQKVYYGRDCSEWDDGYQTGVNDIIDVIEGDKKCLQLLYIRYYMCDYWCYTNALMNNPELLEEESK